jgi:hypothetical protein
MWYKHSFWRNLIDMHIPDWQTNFMHRFAPEQYAHCLKIAEVDTAELYAGNCLGICFWPTQAGHMHRGLQGQDLVGPTLAALRRKGMRTLVYFNIWSRWAFDTHPDWRLLRIDGSQTTQLPGGRKSRYGQCCLNAPGYRDYIQAQITDLADHYAFDGAWIDMLGWFGTICCCPDCRRRYYHETGQEIPEKVDWYDPNWVRFQRCREAWLADLAELIRGTLKARKPEASITFNCAAWQNGWINGNTQAYLDQSDYPAGDFYGDALMMTSICKFLNNAAHHRPIEFMTSRCVSLDDHTTTKTDAELAFAACASFAHNGAFTFIDAINPDGTIHEPFYVRMGQLHQQVVRYQREVRPDATLLRDISFLFNFESFINPAANGTSLYDLAAGREACQADGGPIPAMMNIAKAMINHHLAFDLTCLKAIETARLQSQVMVVPSQYTLLDAELAALKTFVEAGGSLLVTGASGVVDAQGCRLPDFAHAGLTGVHDLGETTEDLVYLRPMPGAEELLAGYNDQYPLACGGHGRLVRCDPDVRVLARLTLPHSHSQEIHRFGSAISNPPGISTEYPAITERTVGRGRVMYVAVDLEQSPFAAQRHVLVTLLRALMNRPVLIETDGPDWLEWLVYRDDPGRRYLVYGLNMMTETHDVVARRVTLSIRLPDRPGRLTNVTEDRQESLAWADGRAVWTAEQVGSCILYVLDDPD